MPTHDLEGCCPEPLGSYLKALGVLRLVHRADPSVRGAWVDGRFVLHTELSQERLVSFFTHDYAPSPILAAWNGGGGLYKRARRDPKTKEVLAYDKPTAMTKATDDLAASEARRLTPIRQFILLAQRGTEALGLETSPNSNVEKPRLLQWLRDRASDDVLPWLDAAFVMEDSETPRYPALLGTGGNDGNLDFANNFQQHLASLMDFTTGMPTESAEGLLRAALFGNATPGIASATPGQFDAGRGGGANSGEGFSGKSLVNPWDFVLFMEGALVLAAIATKRLEYHESGALSFPFAVRTVGAGAGALALSDEESSNNRNELWLPLWDAPATWHEVRHLFGEGRATVGRRSARDAVDFARAIGTLGIDRGISAFVRYGFFKRNGLAFVATPLGRWRVGTHVGSLELIPPRWDRWLSKLRRAAKSGSSSLATAYRSVTESLMALSAEGGQPTDVQRFLTALAQVDQVIGRSIKARSTLEPLPRLHPETQVQWARQADDQSVEFRLALALATQGVRKHILALDPLGRWGPDHDPSVVWTGSSLVDDLLACLRRREIEGPEPVTHTFHTRPSDVLAFIRGELDDRKLQSLIPALAVLQKPHHIRAPMSEPKAVDPLWAIAALAWDQRRPVEKDDLPGRPTPGLIAAGARGDSHRVSGAALRRLRPAQLRHRSADHAAPPLAGLALAEQPATREHTRRCVAALAFPLSDQSLETLTRVAFRVDAASTSLLES